VSGDCYLDGASDHSGTTVLFDALSPSATTDSTITGSGGHFSIDLTEGLYRVSYSHEGYLSFTLAEDPLFGPGGATLDPVTLLEGMAQEVQGTVSGTWSPDFVYRLVGDATVLAADSLLILPGTTVQFMGDYRLLVQGHLIAAGAPEDSVRFVSGNAVPQDFRGVEFDYLSSGGEVRYSRFERGLLRVQRTDRCVIENCLFSETEVFLEDWIGQTNVTGCSFEESGIRCEGDASTITCNTIQRTGVGIQIWFASTPFIHDNTITTTGSYGHGINCNNSSPTVSRNRITVDEWDSNGILIYDGSAGILEENLIVALERPEAGIFCSVASPTLSRNTILASGTTIGIALWETSSVIRHNVVVSEGDGILALTGPGVPTIVYNDILANPAFSGSPLPPQVGVIVTTNANGDSCDTYYNIFEDPQFADPSAGSYELLPSSPCIDAGDPDPAYQDLDGTIADLGALPHLQVPLPAPVVTLVGAPTIGPSPLRVSFSHTNSGGPISSWLWDFGDGTTSRSANPVHHYVSDVPATYTVTLTAFGPDSVGVAIESDYVVVNPATSVVGSRPTRFVLHSNEPNPFRQLTHIGFDLTRTSPVDLRVFDVTGRLVSTLVSGELREAGRHRVSWDGRDPTGRRLADGVYFYRLQAGDRVATGRMVLLR
jgi:hypothetical protein